MQCGPRQEMCGRARAPPEERVSEPAQPEMFQPPEVSLQSGHHPALQPRPGRGLSGEPAVFCRPQTGGDSGVWEDQGGDLPGGAPHLLSLRPHQALSGPHPHQVPGQAGPASVLQDPQPALSEGPQQELFSTAADQVQLWWKMMIMMERRRLRVVFYSFHRNFESLIVGSSRPAVQLLHINMKSFEADSSKYLDVLCFN